MSTEFSLLQAVEQLGKEKGMEREIVIAALEEAMAAASRKALRTREDLIGRFNMENGTVDIFAIKTIVDEVLDEDRELPIEEAREIDPDAEVGWQVEFPRYPENLGRIAAQAAKQVIYQKLREAEREIIFNEYEDRVGQVINGIVKRFERGDIIVDLGRAEALLPRSQQSRVERYSQGDRIRALILDVKKNTKGPQVILTRTSPELIKSLFEMEVPEIYDGTVTIELAAREAGDRTKIAVVSHDRDVDPIGACVGMRGVRVQSIIRELRGERIDIIPYTTDQLLFVRNALAPAPVTRVNVLDEEERRMEVIVPEDQLSLAIGKKGQNVRLASELTGWHLEVRSDESRREALLEDMDAQFAAELEEMEAKKASESDSSEEVAEVAEEETSEETTEEASEQPAEVSEIEAGENEESEESQEEIPSDSDEENKS